MFWRGLLAYCKYKLARKDSQPELDPKSDRGRSLTPAQGRGDKREWRSGGRWCSALFQEQGQLSEIEDRDEHEEADEEGCGDVLDNSLGLGR